MEPLYIYHHMGLGDHLINNALVRSLVQSAPVSGILFVKPEYLETVKFMYRDIPNLKFGLGSDSHVERVLQDKQNVVKIGFSQMNTLSGPFDERFYKLAGIPFSLRWDGFFYNPDTEREQNLFKQLNLEKGKYIFVHDDANRNLICNSMFFLDKTLPVIRPYASITNNIFDWLEVLRHAKEIHVMDSCFFHLVEIPNLKTTDLIYYHRYLKGVSLEGNPSYRKKWIVI
jgi:hypothetical protein